MSGTTTPNTSPGMTPITVYIEYFSYSGGGGPESVTTTQPLPVGTTGTLGADGKVTIPDEVVNTGFFSAFAPLDTFYAPGTINLGAADIPQTITITGYDSSLGADQTSGTPEGYSGNNYYDPNYVAGAPASPPTELTITATDADKLADTPPASTPNTIPGSQPDTTTPFTFTITRSGNSSSAGTVNYSVAGSGTNPAQAGDFVGGKFPSGTVSFAAGQTSKTLKISLGDHLTPPEPNVGFTVTATAGSNSASANGNIKGVDTPSVAVLADMANAAYTPSTTKVDGYAQDPSLTSATNAGNLFPGTGFLPSPDGFFAEAFQDGNQVVVALRGTDKSSWKNLVTNLVADKSWLGGTSTPNAVLTGNVAQAAEFLAQVKAKYPDANITLTGHSLGGAIAEVLSWASGSSATTFNAPGMGQFEQALVQAGALTAVNPVGAPAPETNYRVHGDQVSLAGTPIGPTVTLNSHNPDTAADALANHVMTEVVSDLGNVRNGPPEPKLPLTKLLTETPPNASAQISPATTSLPTTMSFLTANDTSQTISAHASGQTLMGSSQYGDTFQGTSANLNSDLIKLFGGNDLIDVTDLNFARATLSYSGTAQTGALSLTDGVHSIRIGLAGDFSQTHFHLASDTHGGTNVTYA